MWQTELFTDCVIQVYETNKINLLELVVGKSSHFMTNNEINRTVVFTSLQLVNYNKMKLQICSNACIAEACNVHNG